MSWWRSEAPPSRLCAFAGAAAIALVACALALAVTFALAAIFLRAPVLLP